MRCRAYKATWFLLSLALFHVDQLEACSRCDRSAQSYGSKSTLRYMTSTDFPQLKLSRLSVADDTDIQRQLKEHQDTNESNKFVSTILGILSAATPVTDVAWNFIERLFIDLMDTTDLKIAQLAMAIRNRDVSTALQQFRAKLLAIKDSVRRLMDEGRFGEVQGTTRACTEILELFNDEGYVFWRENNFTADSLLIFAGISATVGKWSKRLDPTHSSIVDREHTKLLAVLGKYHASVKDKRLQGIVEGSKREVSALDAFLTQWTQSSEDARESVCDHLFYSAADCVEEAPLACRFCPKPHDEDVIYSYNAHLRPIEAGRPTYRCVKGLFSEQLNYFYTGSWFSSSKKHPTQNVYYSREPNYDDWRPPAFGVKYVHDTITDQYACNYARAGVDGGCLTDYRNFVGKRVDELFETVINFVKRLK